MTLAPHPKSIKPMPLCHSPAALAAAAEARSAPLPAEAEFILSALEAAHRGKIPGTDRRSSSRRVSYRTVATLELFSDPEGIPPWILYTRDAGMQALGFITQHRLPLGYGGAVVLLGPHGDEVIADCTLQRCRETVLGWFEGCLAFNRPQWSFCDKSPE